MVASDVHEPSRSVRRVLIVDDNEDAALLLAAAVEHWGHAARTCFDGGSALAAASEFEPDIVFLDLGLPDMDGCEVAARLRTADLPKQPELVALTGWAHDQDRQRTSQSGFDRHLVKPVELERIEQILASHARPR